MNLSKMIENNIEDNYSGLDAISKMCQDVLLCKIANSNFNENVTIKGGIVMHYISKNNRRATQDIDLDFIKYSLDDYSIIAFLKKLNNIDDGIEIIIGDIKKLKHQDYDGKRVEIVICDKDNKYPTKLDIGVHKNTDIKQDYLCFDFNFDCKNASLFVNSKEQIFTEKMKSLLKHGIFSTRYKDLFDMYYLINNCNMKINDLEYCFEKLIFNDENTYENNFPEILERLDNIFNNNNYLKNISNAKKKWIDITTDELVNTILNYISTYV